MNLLKLNTTTTMSSVEVAELTGKRHDNVLADIRAMMVEATGLRNQASESTYKDSTGRTVQHNQRHQVVQINQRRLVALR